MFACSMMMFAATLPARHVGDAFPDLPKLGDCLEVTGGIPGGRCG